MSTSKKQEQAATIFNPHGEVIAEQKPQMLYAREGELNRSNLLIQSRWRGSRFDTQVLYLAMYNIQHDRAGYRTSFSVNDIKDILGIPRERNIYRKLKNCSMHFLDYRFFIEDPEKQQFAGVNVVGDCTLENGVFTVKFNDTIAPHLHEFSGPFTPMLMDILMSFDQMNQNYSIRLYELLRTHSFHITKDRPTCAVQYGLADLKITIGVVDVNDVKVREAIGKKLSPESIVEEYSDRDSYRSFGDFKKYVLDPSIKEINEKTDLYVEYKQVRSGHGGKTTAINFFISRNKNWTGAKKIVDNGPDKELIEEVASFIEEPLSESTIEKLLSVSGNDISLIRDAYELSKNQTHIMDIGAWLYSAIKEKWADSEITKMKGLGYAQTAELDEIAGFINNQA